MKNVAVTEIVIFYSTDCPLGDLYMILKMQF